MIILLLLILTGIYGCIAPSVVVEKNITVHSPGPVTIIYSTRADLKTAVDLIQDIKPNTDLKLK